MSLFLVIPALFVVGTTVINASINIMEKDVIRMRHYFAGGYNMKLKEESAVVSG